MPFILEGYPANFSIRYPAGYRISERPNYPVRGYPVDPGFYFCVDVIITSVKGSVVDPNPK
jgi:hypothetical protein